MDFIYNVSIPLMLTNKRFSISNENIHWIQLTRIIPNIIVVFINMFILTQMVFN